jgi:hypothetical protein
VYDYTNKMHELEVGNIGYYQADLTEPLKHFTLKFIVVNHQKICYILSVSLMDNEKKSEMYLVAGNGVLVSCDSLPHYKQYERLVLKYKSSLTGIVEYKIAIGADGTVSSDSLQIQDTILDTDDPIEFKTASDLVTLVPKELQNIIDVKKSTTVISIEDSIQEDGECIDTMIPIESKYCSSIVLKVVNYNRTLYIVDLKLISDLTLMLAKGESYCDKNRLYSSKFDRRQRLILTYSCVEFGTRFTFSVDAVGRVSMK